MDLATQRYLSSLSDPPRNRKPIEPGDGKQKDCKSTFLQLPLEIRRIVYGYLLPSAKPSKPAYNADNVVWQRGSLAFLRTSGQVNEEASEILYSQNIFIADVRHGSISLRTQWSGKFQDYRSSSRPFLDTITKRNLSFVRYLVVNVQHVDSYTGMIKYNTQGPGLTHSLRVQVKKLVDALIEEHSLRRLKVHLSVWSESKRATQIGHQSYSYPRPHTSFDTATEDLADPHTALEPFAYLRGIPSGIEVDGDVNDETVEYLNTVTQGSRHDLLKTPVDELGFLDLTLENPIIVKRKW